MPFEPGNTEHKKANRNKPRIIAQQLTAALNEAAGEGDATKLRRLVDKLIDKALEGDVPAIKEVIDRVDGKVPTPVVGDDSEDPVTLLHRIERVIVDPQNRNSESVPPAA